jgi:hypothetical protein
MLNHELRLDEGILVLRPDGPLEASDFAIVQNLVDAYLAKNGTLRGVLIRADQGFPGWKDFAALVAHLKFVKDHHRQIENIAVVVDGGVTAIMPSIADYFIHAQVKHFALAHEDAAWDWLEENSDAPMHTAA